MTVYKVQIADLATQYIRIQAEISSAEAQTHLVFPAWRPGRYELGNFAKNVRNIKVYDSDFKSVSFEKINKNEWLVNSSNTDVIHIDYLFHASELNAGSTFVSDEQLYMNPVNCMVYKKDDEDTACSLELEIPKSWEVACALPLENNKITAKSYHQLVDSPFIASPSLQHDSYEVSGHEFHIWFQGEVKPDWSRLKRDFRAFTEKQLAYFGDFPFENYHFLFQITPYQTYHGVEHLDSTVIALGPSYDIFGKLYTELLGVSSHELYHAWNIKSIRPIEMHPYDYSKENYSKLGFVCEGVTTYLGDQFLLKSGVFDVQQYALEMGKNIQRHFDNFGRFSMSVSDASFDTWLDGYVQGAPHRKTSIYTEGALIAFICDTMIMRATNNTKSLNDVMRNLYQNFAKKNLGYSVEDYKNELEQVSGISFNEVFDSLVFGTISYEGLLKEALDYVGFSFEYESAKKISHAQFGVKTLVENGVEVIKRIYPGGDFDEAGVVLEDKIIGMNQMAVHSNFEHWCNYFQNETNVELLIERSGRLLNLSVPITSKNYYLNYKISKLENPSKAQREAFNFWKK